jgi:hypothetical protein
MRVGGYVRARQPGEPGWWRGAAPAVSGVRNPARPARAHKTHRVFRVFRGCLTVNCLTVNCLTVNSVVRLRYPRFDLTLF